MEFGKIALHEVAATDFSLPADPVFNQETLQQNAPQQLKAHVGCVGWGSKDWLGEVYPAGTKESKFWEAYSKQFNLMELNATFYQIYPAETIAKWKERAAANPDFLFCPKFPKQISHAQSLYGTSDLTKIFYENIRAFQEKLGPLFLQLSDYFGPERFAELETYLQQLPKDIPVFVELRHEGWFLDQQMKEKVFAMFRNLNIGAIITDVAGRRDVTHMYLPVPSAFIRFVASNELSEIAYKRADVWIERIKNWQQQGLQSLYLFVHLQQSLLEPKMVAYFIERLNADLGLQLKQPQFIPKPLSLF
ncbi:MAG: DUF72 domain-containing protein [Sphingobacteriaceae bacterium]|nr:MAG: DUF72 domain-containing protein [Sphingobacteriaceae bacterium]